MATLPTTLDLTSPNFDLTLTFANGEYNFGAVSFEVITVNHSSRSIGLYFLGTFTGTGWDPSPALVSLSLTQSSPGSTISGSATFSTSGTPEPATMALLGSALIGVGVFGGKRFAR